MNDLIEKIEEFCDARDVEIKIVSISREAARAFLGGEELDLGDDFDSALDEAQGSDRRAFVLIEVTK